MGGEEGVKRPFPTSAAAYRRFRRFYPDISVCTGRAISSLQSAQRKGRATLAEPAATASSQPFSIFAERAYGAFF